MNEYESQFAKFSNIAELENSIKELNNLSSDEFPDKDIAIKAAKQRLAQLKISSNKLTPTSKNISKNIAEANKAAEELGKAERKIIKGAENEEELIKESKRKEVETKRENIKESIKNTKENIDPSSIDTRIINDMFGESDKSIYFEPSSPYYWRKNIDNDMLAAYAYKNNINENELFNQFQDMERRYNVSKATDEWKNTGPRDFGPWIQKSIAEYIFPDVVEKALRTGEGPTSWGELLTNPAAIGDFGMAILENFNPLRYGKIITKVPGVTRMIGDAAAPAAAELVREGLISDIPDNIDPTNIAVAGGLGLVGGEMMKNIAQGVFGGMPGAGQLVNKMFSNKPQRIENMLNEKQMYNASVAKNFKNIEPSNTGKYAGSEKVKVNPSDTFVEGRVGDAEILKDGYETTEKLAKEWSNVKTEADLANLMEKYPVYKNSEGILSTNPKNFGGVDIDIPGYAKPVSRAEWENYWKTELNKVPALKESFIKGDLKSKKPVISELKNKNLKNASMNAASRAGSNVASSAGILLNKGMPQGAARYKRRDDAYDIEKKAQLAIEKRSRGEKLTQAELDLISSYLKSGKGIDNMLKAMNFKPYTRGPWEK